MQADVHVGWLGTGRMGTAMAARLIYDGAAAVSASTCWSSDWCPVLTRAYPS
jgi:3-hydroxyisobutyrate dehydrogenase-like beta-hydroxyacid dehydrogenase